MVSHHIVRFLSETEESLVLAGILVNDIAYYTSQSPSPA